MSITPSNRRIKGVLCILCAAFGFALMNMFVKLSGDLPTFQKAFFPELYCPFGGAGPAEKGACPL